jgi:hypothetical protein
MDITFIEHIVPIGRVLLFVLIALLSKNTIVLILSTSAPSLFVHRVICFLINILFKHTRLLNQLIIYSYTTLAIIELCDSSHPAILIRFETLKTE